MNKNIILKVKNLYVEFDSEKVIENLSFEVKENETLVILGPNGAGKTVLLRTLLGLLPYRGKIQWRPGLKIGYVTTGLPSVKDIPLTVEELFGLKGTSRKESSEILTKVGMLEPNVLEKQVRFLSTGQFQRVLVAWGLSGNSQALLFDEPVFGIDIGGQETIYSLLNKLREERNPTIILVSHDLDIVYKFTTNVLCLNKKALCYGPPKEVLSPDMLSQLYGGEVKFYQHQHA